MSADRHGRSSAWRGPRGRSGALLVASSSRDLQARRAVRVCRRWSASPLVPGALQGRAGSHRAVLLPTGGAPERAEPRSDHQPRRRMSTSFVARITPCPMTAIPPTTTYRMPPALRSASTRPKSLTAANVEPDPRDRSPCGSARSLRRAARPRRDRRRAPARTRAKARSPPSRLCDPRPHVQRQPIPRDEPRDPYAKVTGHPTTRPPGHVGAAGAHARRGQPR